MRTHLEKGAFWNSMGDTARFTQLPRHLLFPAGVNKSLRQLPCVVTAMEYGSSRRVYPTYGMGENKGYTGKKSFNFTKYPMTTNTIIKILTAYGPHSKPMQYWCSGHNMGVIVCHNNVKHGTILRQDHSSM